MTSDTIDRAATTSATTGRSTRRRTLAGVLLLVPTIVAVLGLAIEPVLIVARVEEDHRLLIFDADGILLAEYPRPKPGTK